MSRGRSCTTTHCLPCGKTPFHSFLQLYKSAWIPPDPCAPSSWTLSHCTHSKQALSIGSCCSGVRFSSAYHEIFYRETVSPPWHIWVTFPYLMNTVTTAHFRMLPLQYVRSWCSVFKDTKEGNFRFIKKGVFPQCYKCLLFTKSQDLLWLQGVVWKHDLHILKQIGKFARVTFLAIYYQRHDYIEVCLVLGVIKTKQKCPKEEDGVRLDFVGKNTINTFN